MLYVLLCVQTYEAHRAQAELDLPRVAVIGNQSAGKSSLVEAISGVGRHSTTVPNNSLTRSRLLFPGTLGLVLDAPSNAVCLRRATRFLVKYQSDGSS